MSEEGGGRSLVTDPDVTARSVLTTLGGAIAVVGLVELGVLWFPPRLGSAAWEFGTINETSRVLPITGLGLALLVYGVIRNPNARAEIVRAASVTFIVLAALLGLGAVVYARTVSAVLAAAPSHAIEAVYRSFIKTGVSLVASIATCILIARLLWRATRAN